MLQKKIGWRYDPQVDMGYIELGTIVPGEATKQLEVEKAGPIPMRLILDFDDAGHLLGIEVFAAEELLRPEMMRGDVSGGQAACVYNPRVIDQWEAKA